MLILIYRFFLIHFWISLKAELENNENASVIRFLKININNQDLEDDGFPNKFLISFSKFQKIFNVTFVKLSKSHSSYPITSSDIYVIDEKTDEPVKYAVKNKEVI